MFSPFVGAASVTLTSIPNPVFAKELLGWPDRPLPPLEHLDKPLNGLAARVELVRDETGFAALEPHWDRLLEESASRSPFLRWDWARFWWQHFGEDYRLVLVVVRDVYGVPEAIAPLVIGHSVTGARRYLRQLCWIGGVGAVEGEVMDLLVPAGREAELTPLLCEGIRWLSPEWQAVRLNKLPAESPNFPILLNSLRSYAAGAGVVSTHASRFASLPSDWPGLAAQRSGRWRRNLRKRWDAFTGDHGGVAGLAGETMPAAAAVDALAALHCGRWCDGGSTFVKDRAWEFHRSLALRWLAEGRALLPFLSVQGQMVAGCYGFVEGDRFYHYQLGWDARYAELSPGNLAIMNTVQHCMRLGLRCYDMLSGDYRYKLEWCPGGRDLADIEAYSPFSPTAACFRGLRSIKRFVCQPSRGEAMQMED